MKILVTVKAYPGLGQTDGETVCVAGVRLDGATPDGFGYGRSAFASCLRARSSTSGKSLTLPRRRRRETCGPNRIDLT